MIFATKFIADRSFNKSTVKTIFLPSKPIKMVVSTGILVIFITWLGYKLYEWMWSGYDTFEKQGIPFVKPYPVMGSLWGLVKKTATIRDFLIEAYGAYPNASVVGIYDQSRIAYMLRDPELVKRIGVKDFDHFPGKQLILYDFNV